jgi:hypothetical protein
MLNGVLVVIFSGGQHPSSSDEDDSAVTGYGGLDVSDYV